MGLIDELRAISKQINEQGHFMTTEAATKQVSIRPFIRALGYDIYNLHEVQPEYTADARASGSERVDYAIKQQGKPIILIEVKSAGTTLTENHWRQLHNYFGALDVEFGILTNGIEYRFYTDHKKRNIMDKEPLLVLNMLKLDSRLANVLEGLTKSRFDPERTAYKLKIFSLVEKEYNQPSDEFVKFFARQIYSRPLFQRTIKEFAPIVKQAWRDLVDREITSRLQRHEESEPAPVETEAEPIVEEKPIKPISGDSVEVPVFTDYRGRRFEATLFFNESNTRKSKIRFEGVVTSPSRAGKTLKHSINPGGTGETSGWTFWKLRDPSTNQERPISDLRQDNELVRRLLSYYRQG